MHIDLDKIDRTQFLVHEHIVAGEMCFLVQPQHIGAEWTSDNLIFRSSLWNARGEPVSLSWKKHFNWEEKPEIDLVPRSLEGVELMEKIDGSTLLVSAYKGRLIVRTRGTVDATKLDNGDEIGLFKQRYRGLFTPENLSSNYITPPQRHLTICCEWVSPRNQIVIAYPEPELYLTGVINHDDYSYWSQSKLDWLAPILGLKRPRRYRFDTIPQMLEAVSTFQGVEGVCAYYNQGQSWRKIKAAQYLILHRFKENVTQNNILDLFFQYQRPHLALFKELIRQHFDWECAQMASELVTKISEANMRAVSRYNLIGARLTELKDWSRRDAALKIQEWYGGLDRSLAFHILSGKPLDDKILRKVIEEELDKIV